MSASKRKDSNPSKNNSPTVIQSQAAAAAAGAAAGSVSAAAAAAAAVTDSFALSFVRGRAPDHCRRGRVVKSGIRLDLSYFTATQQQESFKKNLS